MKKVRVQWCQVWMGEWYITYESKLPKNKIHSKKLNVNDILYINNIHTILDIFGYLAFNQVRE